jgi:hypothetical protein
LKAENDLAGSGYALKHRFLNIAQVVLCASHKEGSQFVLNLLKHRYLFLEQFAFWVVQEAENGFARPFDSSKNSFLDFVQVSFLKALNAENDFAGSGYPSRHSLLELAQDVFCVATRQKVSL